MMFNCSVGQAPAYLTEQLTEQVTRRSLRSSDSVTGCYNVPFNRRKTFADRAFKTVGPKLWDNLPSRVRTSESSSGVKVHDQCQVEYEKLKLKHTCSYLIFKMSKDNKEIVVDHIGEKGKCYDDFKDELTLASKNHEGRYAILDCEYAKGKASKLVFIMWLSDNDVGMKQKMLYTSSKKALTDKLQGIAKEVQCNDLDDLSWCNIVEKCQSKYD